MDFDFSDDQEQLRDAVRKWVDKGYDFERRRAIVKAGGFDRGAYGELAELGLAGLYIPEEHGGMGMGPVEGMVVMEELGRGIVLEPLAPDADRRRRARRLRARSPEGRMAAEDRRRRGAGGAGAAGAQGPLSAGRLRDAGHAGRRRLDAQRRQEPGARRATRPTPSWCRPRPNGKIALFLVERRRQRRHDARLRHPGRRPRGRGRVQGAPAALVTPDGLTALEHAVDIGIAATCAEAVGVIDKTMDVTVEYMNTRKQFGVTLSTFQALRHRVADMKMQLELARSMSYYASLKLNAPAEERRRAMARAKYQLGVSMRFVGQNSVQLHGGIGVTDEYIGSHYFKKLTQLELSFGDTLHHLGEVSRTNAGHGGRVRLKSAASSSRCTLRRDLAGGHALRVSSQ